MSPDQRRAALVTANKRRKAVAEIRAEISASRENACRVLLDPPEPALGLAVIEVLVLARSSLGWRSAGVKEIGARALRDNVNVLVPLGEASQRTREWAATEGMVWARGARRSARECERVSA